MAIKTSQIGAIFARAGARAAEGRTEEKKDAYVELSSLRVSFLALRGHLGGYDDVTNQILNYIAKQADQCTSACEKFFVQSSDGLTDDFSLFIDGYDALQTEIDRLILYTSVIKDLGMVKGSGISVPVDLLSVLSELSGSLEKNKEVISSLAKQTLIKTNDTNQYAIKNRMTSDKASIATRVRDFLDEFSCSTDERSSLAEAVELMIRVSVAKSSRVKWIDKGNHENLAMLSAPQFLKAVHAADITNGIVDKGYFRSIDKDLMDAVDGYLSRRMDREGPLDLGHAEGLTFQASRPGRNVKIRSKASTSHLDHT